MLAVPRDNDIVTLGPGQRADVIGDVAGAIHLHGQHSYEIGVDGSIGDYHDTTLLEPGHSRF